MIDNDAVTKVAIVLLCQCQKLGMLRCLFGREADCGSVQ